MYPKAPGTVQFAAEPEPSVHIVIASGGCGMTMSFGLADETVVVRGTSTSGSDGHGESPPSIQAPYGRRRS